MRVVTSQWGLTRPSSIFFTLPLDKVRDIVPLVSCHTIWLHQMRSTCVFAGSFYLTSCFGGKWTFWINAPYMIQTPLLYPWPCPMPLYSPLLYPWPCPMPMSAWTRWADFSRMCIFHTEIDANRKPDEIMEDRSPRSSLAQNPSRCLILSFIPWREFPWFVHKDFHEGDYSIFISLA